MTTTKPRLVDRLRNPRTTDLVQVSFTGTPQAVTAIARALASVACVTGMRHQVQGEQVIRLDATCHRLPLTRRGAK
jgi:hypothetical protein